MSEEKIPYSTAILRIFISVMLVSGTAFMGWLYYLNLQHQKELDGSYKIVSVVQGTMNTNQLRTDDLVTLLDLSSGVPQNLANYDLQKAKERLLKLPVLREVMLSKKFPGTLCVLYEMREPLGYVSDKVNTAIDSEGVPFPFYPYYTPKRLPRIRFGLNSEDFVWGKEIKDKNLFKRGLELIAFIQFKYGRDFFLSEIDLLGLSHGEVTLTLVETEAEWLGLDSKVEIKLKINTEDFEKSLSNLVLLHANLKKRDKFKRGPIKIDMRVSQLAFIQFTN